jgi:hypothetical protein
MVYCASTWYQDKVRAHFIAQCCTVGLTATQGLTQAQPKNVRAAQPPPDAPVDMWNLYYGNNSWHSPKGVTALTARHYSTASGQTASFAHSQQSSPLMALWKTTPCTG